MENKKKITDRPLFRFGMGSIAIGFIFGLFGCSIQMQWAIICGLVLIILSMIDDFEKVKLGKDGAELIRKAENKITELTELEERLKKQEEDLEQGKKDIKELSDHFVNTVVDANTGIGALFLELGHNTVGVDIAMKGIDYYAHRPLDASKSRVDAMLSGIIGKLASSSSQGEIKDLFNRNRKAALRTYNKMKENNVPSEIIEKYEKILEKTEIDYKAS